MGFSDEIFKGVQKFAQLRTRHHLHSINALGCSLIMKLGTRMRRAVERNPSGASRADEKRIRNPPTEFLSSRAEGVICSLHQARGTARMDSSSRRSSGWGFRFFHNLLQI